MIRNDTPQHEAILSNVVETGEFRIRNSAKAFSILSSGLYANKIRAIVRELSTNAYDSHVDSGHADLPFDVHLPNALEPWFAVRDYGTGLDHDQVSKIYTTYFESTKTTSDEFVGCLGLGSKSPFSYTDNFTVTAIKNGRKGIYSAFINEVGVPSIALMSEEDSAEPAGLEVKFAVNDRWDFDKFASEASSVYQYFKTVPNVTGNNRFTVRTVEYETKDIIPGVSSLKSGNSRSIAIMGNIAYPIEVPNHATNLGEVANLLFCSLELRFNIGELDIQASREGLSYIPSTIKAIKDKLEQLNNSLTKVIAEEADKISNDWERAFFLQDKMQHSLWAAAAKQYIVTTKFTVFDTSPGSYSHRYTVPFKAPVDDLEKKYNIKISSFAHRRGKITTFSPDHERSYSNNTPMSYYEWKIRIDKDALFVTNDTTVGAGERAKYHCKNDPTVSSAHSTTVYVLDKADPKKPALYDKFLKKILNPPNVVAASSLLVKPKKTRQYAQLSSAMVLSSRQTYGRTSDRYVWDSVDVACLDDTVTYYYLPLSGFTSISKFTGYYSNPKSLQCDLKDCGIAELASIRIYGIRKADLPVVEAKKNWVNVEEHIVKILANSSKLIAAAYASKALSYSFRTLAEHKELPKLISPKSPMMELVELVSNTKTRGSIDSHVYDRLRKVYLSSSAATPVATTVSLIEAKVEVLKTRYPMLGLISGAIYDNEVEIIAKYINMIDQEDKTV